MNTSPSSFPARGGWASPPLKSGGSLECTEALMPECYLTTRASSPPLCHGTLPATNIEIKAMPVWQPHARDLSLTPSHAFTRPRCVMAEDHDATVRRCGYTENSSHLEDRHWREWCRQTYDEIRNYDDLPYACIGGRNLIFLASHKFASILQCTYFLPSLRPK